MVLAEQGLTQKAFALKIGRTQKFVSGLINGGIFITPKTAIQLARATGLPVEYWMALEKAYRAQEVTVSEGAPKTAPTRQTSLGQSNARLRSLDEATQEHIAQKYYGGRRPWAGVRQRTRHPAAPLRPPPVAPLGFSIV
ncbi:MAG: hypothetical protein DDT35_00425 [Firmicutes bacterium]|nr:hypothetical protein [Bacillota bacterium]